MGDVVLSQEEVEELKNRIKTLESRSEKLKQDFEMYKGRVQRDRERNMENARRELKEKLLDVADTLYRALNYETDHRCEVMKRVSQDMKANTIMTYCQLLRSLDLVPIAPFFGESFDDEKHTAIRSVKDPFYPDKTVVKLVRMGYLADGKVLRPAEVVISKNGFRHATGGESMEGLEVGIDNPRKGIREKDGRISKLRRKIAGCPW